MTSRVKDSATPSSKTAERKAPPVADPELEALSAYYKSSYWSLYKHALSVVHCPETANDIVHDAFADTAATMKQGIEIKNLHAWLQAVVRNLCRNKVSKRSMRNKAWVPLDEDLCLADPVTPAEIAHTKKRCEDVNSALGRLAPAQRSAFLLAELRGLEYREIADTLGRTEDSVRQLLARARAYVRNAVGSDAIPLSAPLIQLETLGGLWRERQDRPLRDYLAAKLANLQSSVATLAQRTAELAAQPAAALLTGALVVGALNAPFITKDRDRPNGGDRAHLIAVTPSPSLQGGLPSSKEVSSPIAQTKNADLSPRSPAIAPMDSDANSAPSIRGDDIAPLESKPAENGEEIVAEPAGHDEEPETPEVPGDEGDGSATGGREPPDPGPTPPPVTEDDCDPVANYCDPNTYSTSLTPPSPPPGKGPPDDGGKGSGNPNITEVPPKSIEVPPKTIALPPRSGELPNSSTSTPSPAAGGKENAIRGATGDPPWRSAPKSNSSRGSAS